MLQRGPGVLMGEVAAGASRLVCVVILAAARDRDALRLCACRHGGPLPAVGRPNANGRPSLLWYR